ncbi:MAG: hypothetical protein ACREE7_07845 [Dongiaceae bacterium]
MVVLAVALGLGGVVSGPVAPGVVGSVLAPDVVPELAVDVSVPAAFCVDVLGLVGWALSSCEVFAAVSAVGGVAPFVPLDGTSRFTK